MFGSTVPGDYQGVCTSPQATSLAIPFFCVSTVGSSVFPLEDGPAGCGEAVHWEEHLWAGARQRCSVPSPLPWSQRCSVQNKGAEDCSIGQGVSSGPRPAALPLPFTWPEIGPPALGTSWPWQPFHGYQHLSGSIGKIVSSACQVGVVQAVLAAKLPGCNNRSPWLNTGLWQLFEQ